MEKFEEMEDEISLIDIIKVLLKRKKLIVGGTLICFTGAIFFAFFKNSPKMYQTSLVIQVGKTENGLIEPLEEVKSKLENEYLFGQGVDNAATVAEISASKRGLSILVVRGESFSPNLGKIALEGLKEKLLNDHDRVIKKQIDDYITKSEIKIALKESNIANNIEAKILLTKIGDLKVNSEALNKDLLYVISNERTQEGSSNLIYEMRKKLTNNAFQIADFELALARNKETLKKDKETLKKDKETLKKDKETLKKDKENISEYRTEGDLFQRTKILQEPTTIEMATPASKKKKVLIFGVIVGMMLSVFLAFFLEFIENNKSQWAKLKG